MLLPYLEKGRIECGVDEAGRGCLAGPVFAAAVILPESFSNELLNDSKSSPSITPYHRLTFKGVKEFNPNPTEISLF